MPIEKNTVENKTDKKTEDLKPVQTGDKLSFKERKEFETLEKEISALEKERKLMEVKMSNAGQEFEKLQEIGEEISNIIVKIDKKELRWLELSDRAEIK